MEFKRQFDDNKSTDKMIVGISKKCKLTIKFDCFIMYIIVKYKRYMYIIYKKKKHAIIKDEIH